jgi:hypothetical protein
MVCNARRIEKAKWKRPLVKNVPDGRASFSWRGQGFQMAAVMLALATCTISLFLS